MSRLGFVDYLRASDRRTPVIIGAALAIAAASGAAGYVLATSGAGDGATAAEGSSDASGREVLYWYDPMVPDKRFDKPGKSPFMDMQLVPKYADEAEGGVKVSPAMVQSLGIRLAAVEVRDIAPAIRAVGRVEIDERLIRQVQTLTPGFVDSLAVRAEGEPVRAGSRLASIYSPELLTAQHEYKSLLKMSRDVAPPSLRQAVRNRLSLLGLPSAAIRRLERGGAPQRTYAIFAPASGVVTEIAARPGAQVTPGQSIVTIAGLSRVWVIAEVPEAQLGQVRVGQPAKLTFPAYPAEEREGEVDYIFPSLNAESRTARVRITLGNADGRLKEGMFANVALLGAGGMSLVVPTEAVIETGRRKVVIVKKANGFVPVEVRTGREAGDWTQITAGLQRGEQVVASGQFLIDSEASLSGVLNRLSAGAANGEQAQEQLALATGVIQSMEQATGRVTIAHGPVPMMNWPPMTMTFKAQNPAMLRGFKKGDRVEFAFQKKQEGDAYVVERLRRDADQ